MNDKKYIINSASGTEVVQILEGPAPKISYPEKVKVNGDINAVMEFVKAPDNNGKLKDSIILVDFQKGVIELNSNPAYSDKGFLITAKLEMFEDLKAFGINASKFFNLTELEKFVRMTRFYFTDKDAHLALTGQLRSFTAKVKSDLAAAADQRGNKNNMYVKEVSSDLATSFKLTIPIYKGLKAHTFLVEICYDVTDSSVRFWLESVELFELLKCSAEDELNPQIKELRNLGFTVITS
jgi:hypothetical protein